MAEMENMYAHQSMDDGRYTFKGTGNAALTTGIIGSALGLLNGGLGILGGNGFMANHANNYVSKEAFDLQKKISEQESTISLLKSEANTEVKIADVYSRLKGDVLEQERINNARHTEQLVWNARQEARLAVLERDVSQLFSMTGLYIEAKKVTPLPMRRYNSFVAPTEPAPDSYVAQA